MDDTEADPKGHKKTPLIIMNFWLNIAANRGAINNKAIAHKKHHESRKWQIKTMKQASNLQLPEKLLF